MTRKSSALPGDRRVRRTQATLQRALIDLVQERELSQITVADVADRADVSRSTFYDHYQDVHELAEAACTSMLDDMFGYVLALDTARAHPADPPEDPDPALTGFFAHFAEHAGLYRSLLGPTGSARVIEHVRRRTTAAAHYSGRLAPTDDTLPPQTADSPGFPLDVPAAFVAGALLGVAADWLQRGCPRTPLEMTILTKPLLIALRPGTGMPPTSSPSTTSTGSFAAGRTPSSAPATCTPP
jgi:AcrR family transcriptional regulator